MSTNNGLTLDVLALPPDDFCVMKMFAQKLTIMQKLHDYQMMSTKHQILHSL